jgi:deoxyhypusine synthase
MFINEGSMYFNASCVNTSHSCHPKKNNSLEKTQRKAIIIMKHTPVIIKQKMTMSASEEAAQLQTIVLDPAASLAEAESLSGGLTVEGFDFDSVADLRSIPTNDLLASFKTMGFQATNLGLAIEEVEKMLNWKAPVKQEEQQEESLDPDIVPEFCKIFLGYTSNQVSSGNRELIRFLVQHKLVHVIVTSAGGIEEDFIKCMGKLHVGSFDLQGAELRKKGLNRIGNLIMPNENYCTFEEWLNPILDEMHERQERDKIRWSPSSMIKLMGERINNPESIYYWAARNNIPVFCPAITDGAIGDMLFFHSYRKEGLVLDLVADIRALNGEALRAAASGLVILGGGVVKHHICNANLMRNGADYAVFINTGLEFDGSDSGASPDEAVSWGKIRMGAKPIKVSCEATIAFPLLVASTFARKVQQDRDQENSKMKTDHLYI